MKQRSFRVRLTLLSTAMIGTLLLLFAGQTWLLLHHQFLESIDSRLRTPAERTAASLNQVTDWAQHFTDEGTEWIDAPANAKFILIVGPDGKVDFNDGRSDWLLREDYRNLIPKIDAFEEPRVQDLTSWTPTQDKPKPSVTSTTKFHTLVSPKGESWRIVVIRGWDRALFMGASIDKLHDELDSAREILSSSVLVGMLFAAFGGWWIAHSALRPVKRVTKIVSQITSLELDERIPLRGDEYTEFSKLVDMLNHMFNRLETSFNQAQRFTADASHELNTPIALMQAEIHTALKLSDPDLKCHGHLLSLAEEVSRLKQITQSLLLLSQTDSGYLRRAHEPFDFSATMNELIEDLTMLCEENQLKLDHEVAPEIQVSGDQTLLTQALQNLFYNALKYNEKSGYIRVRIDRIKETTVRICIENSGSPIPKEQQQRIFDRFYRCDEARSRIKDGFGLGLNLAQEIILSHGGTLKLHESKQSHTEFRIELPIA